MSESAKYTATMEIIRTVHKRLKEKMGEEIPPYYEFYLEKPYDELAGRSGGFVNHEKRCAVDMHDINSTVPFDVRIYIYPGNRTHIRQIIEDKVRWNNDDPSVPTYVVDLELSKEHFTREVRRKVRCPELFTGIPEIMTVLGTSETEAFATPVGELFPTDT